MNLKTWVHDINDMEGIFEANVRYKTERILKRVKEHMELELDNVGYPDHRGRDAELQDGNLDVWVDVSDIEKLGTHDYTFTFGLSGSQAEFIEYGTGLEGSNSPHPNGWAYDGHGESGWFYKSRSDEKVYRTWGLPASCIVYNTKEQMDEIVEEVEEEFR